MAEGRGVLELGPHGTTLSPSAISDAESDDYSFNRIHSCNVTTSSSRLDSGEWDMSREIYLPAFFPTTTTSTAANQSASDDTAPTPITEDLRRMQVFALTRPKCFPFTMAHATVFAGARAHQERMCMWLRWRGYLAILLVPVLCGIIPMLPLSNLSISPTALFWIELFATMMSICVSNSLSMLFTGNFPEACGMWTSKELVLMQELQHTVRVCLF
jgi:hypothetical protein